MTHKYDSTEFEVKKAAKAELEKPHPSPNSVAALRERVTLLEQTLGIDSLEE